ncbi:MAG TPA: VOC family protein [Bryobacteraceae bacterium]|nr:VOC family protein [Bryobacteraceae bacterium]
MKRVTGIGGIFFKARDQEKLYQWYEAHLGLKREPHGQGVALRWRDIDEPKREASTAWAIFEEHTRYFDPSRSPFMINYRVDNLDQLLEALRQEGVEIDPRREEHEYGRFAWIMDPEGNRIELWEPPK